MHTCLKCGPYLPKMTHTCLMHQIYCGSARSVFWIHRICDLYCGNTRSVFWIHKICDLYCGNTRSAFWKHKICDLYCRNTRSVFWEHRICIANRQESWFLCVHKTKTWWTVQVRSGWMVPTYFPRNAVTSLWKYKKFINLCNKITLMEIILGTLWYILMYFYTIYFDSVHGEIIISGIFIAGVRDRWLKFKKFQWLLSRLL